MMPFVTNPSLRRHHVHRDLAVLVLVIVGCAVPFLSQPFHMDDNFYMDMARNARDHLLFPNDAPYDFAGYHVKETGSHSHPPLETYVLAAVQRIAGEDVGREWIYHSVFLFFPVLAGLSLYFLAARFLERPLWPSLALAVCPLVLVMGHNLMTDMPTLALWLAATACFVGAVDSGRKTLYVASAVFQIAAMFFSYQAVSLAPLLGFYQIRRRGRPLGWLVLAIPLVCLGTWIGASSLHYHRFVLGGTGGYVQSLRPLAPAVLGMKAVAFLEYQGWLIIFPIFLLYVFARGLKGRLFALAVLASLYAAEIAVPGYRTVDKFIFVTGLVTGFFVVSKMAVLFWRAFLSRILEPSGLERCSAQFLALWYFGVTAYCLFILPEGSARYVLPLTAPVLIVFYRRLEVMEVTEYRMERLPLLNSAMVASGSLVLSLAWGLFLAQADYEFARVYPRAAAEYKSISDGLHSYLAGEWGFRYYLGRTGVKPLPGNESSVSGGSLVVTPKLAMPYDMPADLRSMTMPYARLSFDLKTPFRTMDTGTPAAFYSTGWGLIPFSVTNQSLETLEVRQINFMVERLPWARVECSGSVMPWPGLVSIGDQTLAILAKPGTSISYPWKFPKPLNLDLLVGIVPEGAEPVSDASFHFLIQHRDGRGNVLGEVRKVLSYAIKSPDRKWMRVGLALAGASTEGETLVFTYEAEGKSTTTGAFAQAILKPRS